jgi:hypothetical protein
VTGKRTVEEQATGEQAATTIIKVAMWGLKEKDL